jgi:hypothetical protein
MGVGEAMQIVQLFERARDVVLGRRNQFDQRFGVVGGDERMRERRAECARMWRGGERAADKRRRKALLEGDAKFVFAIAATFAIGRRTECAEPDFLGSGHFNISV